jgi:hypothetical protein
MFSDKGSFNLVAWLPPCHGNLGYLCLELHDPLLGGESMALWVLNSISIMAI